MRLTKIMHENKIHQKIHNDTYFTKNETYKNNSTKQKWDSQKYPQKQDTKKWSIKMRLTKMIHKNYSQNYTYKNETQDSQKWSTIMFHKK